MKKLLWLSLLLIPFNVVSAASEFEVIDEFEDVVYVIEETEYQDVLSVCDPNLTFNFDTVQFIPESKVGTIILFEYYDGTTEEIFTYDFATGSCQKGEDAYYSYAEEHYYDLREVYYYPSDGKLYKQELHPYIKSGYLPVAWEDIEMDQKIYYTKHTAWLFYEVDDNSVCETEQCYRKMDAIDLYRFAEINNDVTYYTFNSSQGEFTTVVDNNDCELETCYHEVNIDDYYTESSIADMDKTKFDFAADGLDTNNDIEITAYFEFNGIGHIVIEDSNGNYLYNLDGEMILPISDVYTYNRIVVADDKYLINITFHNDVSLKVTIYDNKYNIIYEKNYDHSGEIKEEEYYMFLSSYENLSVFNKIHIKYDSSTEEIKSLFFTIHNYRLLEGSGQTFTGEELTFKTNGSFDRLLKILVDDKELTESDFTKEEGSTIITIKADYLKTLNEGKHTLKITYNDGGYVETTFNVDEISPQTSDGITFYMTLFIITFASLIGTSIYYKKRMN